MSCTRIVSCCETPELARYRSETKIKRFTGCVGDCAMADGEVTYPDVHRKDRAGFTLVKIHRYQCEVDGCERGEMLMR